MSREELISAIRKAVRVGIIILVLSGLYGAVWVWYRTTGFDEQNAPGKKAQETPGPIMLPGTTIEEIKLQGGPRRSPLSIYAGQAVAKGNGSRVQDWGRHEPSAAAARQ